MKRKYARRTSLMAILMILVCAAVLTVVSEHHEAQEVKYVQVLEEAGYQYEINK
jgi:hypothetical protein